MRERTFAKQQTICGGGGGVPAVSRLPSSDSRAPSFREAPLYLSSKTTINKFDQVLPLSHTTKAPNNQNQNMGSHVERSDRAAAAHDHAKDKNREAARKTDRTGSGRMDRHSGEYAHGREGWSGPRLDRGRATGGRASSSSDLSSSSISFPTRAHLSPRHFRGARSHRMEALMPILSTAHGLRS